MQLNGGHASGKLITNSALELWMGPEPNKQWGCER